MQENLPNPNLNSNSISNPNLNSKPKSIFSSNSVVAFSEVEDFKNSINQIPQIKLKSPSNGTFCPIHKGHMDAMEAAKEYLKTKNVFLFNLLFFSLFSCLWK